MIFAILVFLALKSVLAYFFLKTYKRVKEIKETPTTNIRYLEGGRLELKASISAESETIISPLSQKECVWYSFVIKERVPKGKRTVWVTRVHSRRYKKCILDDGTGTCEFALTYIDFDLGSHYIRSSGTFNDPTEKELRVLRENGIEPQDFFGFNKIFSYEEHILRKGDLLYILGNCLMQQNETSNILIEGTLDSLIFLSDKSKEDLITKIEMRMWGLGLCILFLLCVFLFLFFSNTFS